MRFSPSRALAARWLVSSVISLLPAVLSGQLGPVAGTVTSRASGAPVADVQVTVAGTTLRALTDASGRFRFSDVPGTMRSEEHTSELQSRLHFVCRLLLEKKKNTRH